MNFEISHGKVEAAEVAADSLVQYVRWAPGTGFVFQLMVADVPPTEAQGRLGGHLMVSIECAGRWLTQFFGDVGLWHESVVQEHFNWNNKMTQKEVLLYTALLNWTMGDGDVARDYAEECWDRAGVRRRGSGVRAVADAG